MTSTYNVKLGLTKEFTCNYLPSKQERLLVVIDENVNNDKQYSWLMNQGFRRSGEQVYRPHCNHCNACHSIKVMVELFHPSKSQKRLLKKCRHFTIKHATQSQLSYYPLYEKYINTVHKDGAMFPASLAQYKSFLEASLCEQLFIEVYDNDKLISVAVTDNLPDSLSAVYTFYDPDYRSYALGMFSILNQINIAQTLNKEFLYLGYQIDSCQKMNYKSKFYPHQRLINNQWKIINK